MHSAEILFFIFVGVKVFEALFHLTLNALNLRNLQKAKTMPEFCASFLKLEDYEKSKKYTASKIYFASLTSVWNTAVLLTFLFLGGFYFLETLCLRISDSEMCCATLFCFLILFGKQILDLPFALYHTFVLEKKFAFNKTTPALYARDFVLRWLLTLLLGTPLICFLIWALIQWGPYWWVYGFLGMMGFQVFLLFIYPHWISPLFNTFKPLEAGSLKTGILNIAKKIKFDLSEIFVMDGSKRSTHSNAYFTGFGKFRRIVLFDTLVKSLSTEELLGVLAHEMGHNQLRHIQKTLLISTAMTGIGFYLGSLLIAWKPLYLAFGLSGEHLFPVLVLFPLLMNPLNLLIAPMLYKISRKHEFKADRFSAETTQTPHYLKQALLKLSRDNLSNLHPHPLYSFFHDSHPPIAQRLEALTSNAS
jgi:STE24 endopeptidase